MFLWDNILANSNCSTFTTPLSLELVLTSHFSRPILRPRVIISASLQTWLNTALIMVSYGVAGEEDRLDALSKCSRRRGIEVRRE